MNAPSWFRHLWPGSAATDEAASNTKVAAKKKPVPFELDDVYTTVLIHISHLRDYLEEGTREGRKWLDDNGQVADRDFGLLTGILEDLEWIKQQFEAGVLRAKAMDLEHLREARTRVEETIARSNALEAELENEPPHQAAAIVIDPADDLRVLLVQHGPASAAPSGSYSLPMLPLDDFECPEMAASAAVHAQAGLMVNSTDLAPVETEDEHLSVFWTDRHNGQIKAGSIVAPRWLNMNEVTKLEPSLAAVILAALAARSSRATTTVDA